METNQVEELGADVNNESLKLWSPLTIIAVGVLGGFVGSVVLSFQNFKVLKFDKKKYWTMWALFILYVIYLLSTSLLSYNKTLAFAINIGFVAGLVSIQQKKYKELEAGGKVIKEKIGKTILYLLLSIILTIILLTATTTIGNLFVDKGITTMTGKPVFDPYEGARVTYQNLDEQNKQSLTESDILTIETLETLYIRDKSTDFGQNNELLVAYIKSESAKQTSAADKEMDIKRDKNFTEEQIRAVLEAEKVYNKQIGIQ